MHIHIHNFPLFSFVTNFGEWVRAPARRNEDSPWPHLVFLHEGKPKPYSHSKWVQEFVWNEEVFRYDGRGFWAVVSLFFFGQLLVVVQYYLYVLSILFISCDFVFPAGLRAPSFLKLGVCRDAGAMAEVYQARWRASLLVNRRCLASGYFY